MKTSIAIPAVLLLSALAALAQGTVNFSTRVTGTVFGRVNLPQLANPFVPVYGNTAGETPAGTQVYTGGWVQGSGYSATLWAANGADQPESALSLVPNSLTPMRTGAPLGGTPTPLALAVPGIAPAATGTFQIRVWSNANGQTWDTAIFRGASQLFNVSNLGDGVLTLPADMANFRSFSLYVIPEPSSYLLLGLGGLGAWLARRRKLSS